MGDTKTMMTEYELMSAIENELPDVKWYYIGSAKNRLVIEFVVDNDLEFNDLTVLNVRNKNNETK
tara:strand:- start:352 stop:546 length:195 start_codon:yes stop_codon:yes gene_type:complete